MQCGAEYANVVFVHGRNFPIILACQKLYVEWVVKAVGSGLVQDALRVLVRYEINCSLAHLNTSMCGSRGEETGKRETNLLHRFRVSFVTRCDVRVGIDTACGASQRLNRGVQSPVSSRGAHGSMMPPNCTYAVCPHSASFPVAAVVGGLLLPRRSDPYARRLMISSLRPAFQIFNPSSQQSPRPSSSCPCRPSSFCDPSCASSASMPCTPRRSG